MTTNREHVSSPLEEAVVEGYITQAHGWGGGNHWAWTVLQELLWLAPERGWPLVREIVQRSPPDVLTYIGAGALEDLLSSHGFEVIEGIEQEARRSLKFRIALAGVWRSSIPEPVWERVQALVDEETRSSLEKPEFEFSYRGVNLYVDGRPPTQPGDLGPEQIARRSALLASVREAAGDDFTVWTTPVHLSIRVESGPAGDPSASAGDILAAVIETLALDRPAGLTEEGSEHRGLFAERGLVRESSCFDTFSHVPSYVVRASPMVDEEIAVLSDPRSYEERMADPDEPEALS